MDYRYGTYIESTAPEVRSMTKEEPVFAEPGQPHRNCFPLESCPIVAFS